MSVIIVDNYSTNDSVGKLRAEFPHFTYIMNPANCGFAKGNNPGIRYALENQADYVLLLNNDTIVSPDFLEPLIAAGEANPLVGALSSSIYDYDRSTGPTRRIFYAGGKLSMLRGTGIRFRLGEIDTQPASQPVAAGYVTGCCMLMKRDALLNVGLLDELFFFGVEDYDYSLRLIQQGYQMLWVPGSIIWHKGGASRSYTPDEIGNLYIAKAAFMKKHLPLWLWYPWFAMFAGHSVVTARRVVENKSMPIMTRSQKTALTHAIISALLQAIGLKPISPLQQDEES